LHGDCTAVGLLSDVRRWLLLESEVAQSVQQLTPLHMSDINTGSKVHQRYFQKKGLTLAQQALVVKSRRFEYVAFGIVAFLMNLVPVLNYGFSLASTAGAALWAADLEVCQLGVECSQ
jgi:hypothetical protein